MALNLRWFTTCLTVTTLLPISQLNALQIRRRRDAGNSPFDSYPLFDPRLNYRTQDDYYPAPSELVNFEHDGPLDQDSFESGPPEVEVVNPGDIFHDKPKRNEKRMSSGDDKVSLQELNKIFHDAHSKQDKKANVSHKKKKSKSKKKRTKTKRSTDAQLRENGELFRTYLNRALEAKRVPQKRKRSAPMPIIVEEPLETDVEAIDEFLESPVGKMAAEIQLLRAENNLLTDAVDLATQAQMQGNDPNILVRELNSIAQAEKIQNIYNNMDDDGSDRPPESDSAYDLIPLPEDDREEEVEESMRDDLNSLAKRLAKREPPEEELESCPAVEAFTDNCGTIARVFNVLMDEEARRTCDNHQLCYACVGPEEGAMETCDALYLSQSTRLCSNEMSAEKCDTMINAMLQMMRQVHTRVADVATATRSNQPEVCRQPCVLEYIMMDY